jgi:hypothetical protein
VRDDPLHQIALGRRHVREGPIEVFGPHGVSRHRIDEGRDHAGPAIDEADAAVEDVAVGIRMAAMSSPAMRWPPTTSALRIVVSFRCTPRASTWTHPLSGRTQRY